ncbi:MAG: N-acetyltransferase [Anaerolineales bacterium]|nr:N-acetyltransferase [Anaerolineales bacterium]
MASNNVNIHPTAEVSPKAQIGSGTRVWHLVQIREGVVIGQNCIIGKDVYIDFDVKIGNNVKVQNSALIYHGASLEDGVFIGPQVCLTNDRMPRAITSDGQLKGNDDWIVGPILVKYGASIGAGSLILPDVTVGRFALVGAGSVVTRDVPDHGLVVGNPARLIGYVCHCGRKMQRKDSAWYCSTCDWTFEAQENKK